MSQFNLKKRQNRKKLYSNKENFLFNSGIKIIDDKIKFIKKKFVSCLFLNQSFELKNKKLDNIDTYDLEYISNLDKKYSAIFSNFITQIAFADNLEKNLETIYKRLEDDGLFCFNLLTPSSMRTISNIFIEIDENIFDGAYNRFGPFHDVSIIIEKLNKYNFKEIVVSTDFIEVNYSSLDKIRNDFKEIGISNYYKNNPKFKKDFYTKTYSVFSKIIEKYEYIPVEFEIATFTAWK